MNYELGSVVAALVAAIVAVSAGSARAEAQTNGSEKWVVYDAGIEKMPGKGKHIVLMAGDEEYRSEQAMPLLGKILSKHHGFKCTVLFSQGNNGIIDPYNL